MLLDYITYAALHALATTSVPATWKYLTPVQHLTPAVIVDSEGSGFNCVESAQGWTLTLHNNTGVDRMASVQLKNKSRDNSKSWRVKLIYPASFREQETAPLDPKLWGLNATPHNNVMFDATYGKLLSQTATEAVYLYGGGAVSTPWIQHSVCANVGANTTLEFRCQFFTAPDLNMDNVVDANDLALVWAGFNTPAGDVNGDGKTDAVDSALVLGAWTVVVPPAGAKP